MSKSKWALTNEQTELLAPTRKGRDVADDLAAAQALRYAEELRTLYAEERKQRRAAEHALERLSDSYSTTVRALAAALELRDDETGGHGERVARLALELARSIDADLLADPELEYGFLLHDLGKIGVPDSILLKPGPLTARERETMRDHPILGERIVARVPYLRGTARQIVAAHHERWDGAGYPRRLQGLQVPQCARIFAVVDAFDAMTNERPYRAAQKVEYALAEIKRCAGSQFDPVVVEAFLALREVRSAA
jgi:HD-GYP domain-containing protein (c-di-GMP phosphodiesterase class II)